MTAGESTNVVEMKNGNGKAERLGREINDRIKPAKEQF